MKGARAAKRYAGALIGLAAEMNKADRVAEDMSIIRDLMTSSNDLRLFFRSPIIDRNKKRKTIESLFRGRIDDLTEHFLFLLVDKEREALTEAIAVEFGDLYDQMMGVVRAKVKAAFELDRVDSSAVQSKLEELTSKKVRLSFSIDKSLVGGFVAQVGDTVYDGSVRRQLEILRRQLAGN